MSRRVLSLSVGGGLSHVSLVGPALRGIAEGTGFEKGRAAEIALAVQEAVVNATEHACEGRLDAVVTVEVTVEEGLLEAAVRDAGRPMPAGLLDDARGVEPDPLSERGRGLFLITRLADESRYSSDGSGNVMELRFVSGPVRE